MKIRGKIRGITPSYSFISVSHGDCCGTSVWDILKLTLKTYVETHVGIF
jgi:hypothetical protein